MSLTKAEDLSLAFGLDPLDVEKVLERYPARVNSYYRDLCDQAGQPLLRQVVPDKEEVSSFNDSFPEDPIGEEAFSPVPNLTHRYEDRVLFLVSDLCPLFCRFCTRKRKVGKNLSVTADSLEKGIEYIENKSMIRDVLLSGGDPLMLEDKMLEAILGRLRRIRHVEILRIGSRVPAALPARITPRLASLLSRYGPLFVHTHFNHPAELTEEAKKACSLLAGSGIPLANQTVLLRGVNDDVDTLHTLFRKLLAMRVRPYYLFQADSVRGTAHFNTPLSFGIRTMEELRRRTSPMALPLLAVDLPGSAGKAFPGLATVRHPGRRNQAVITPGGTVVPYPDWK